MLKLNHYRCYIRKIDAILFFADAVSGRFCPVSVQSGTDMAYPRGGRGAMDGSVFRDGMTANPRDRRCGGAAVKRGRRGAGQGAGPLARPIWRPSRQTTRHPRYPHAHTIFGVWLERDHNRWIWVLDAYRRFTLTFGCRINRRQVGASTPRPHQLQALGPRSFPGFGMATAAVRDAGKLRLALTICRDKLTVIYYM